MIYLTILKTKGTISYLLKKEDTIFLTLILSQKTSFRDFKQTDTGWFKEYKYDPLEGSCNNLINGQKQG